MEEHYLRKISVCNQGYTSRQILAQNDSKIEQEYSHDQIGLLHQPLQPIPRINIANCNRQHWHRIRKY